MNSEQITLYYQQAKSAKGYVLYVFELLTLEGKNY